ncbi:Oidioi.mRNA.OKI2018_I69.PAR.g8910.t1.cds [Oikopleura dioica]|uniref:Oidioi.mRNA.OKI2018_I69.PAR.g8910.t1.cds n=1 Tax=Oikopleura dioica TaxID=34765 RepID=A0ABN7RJ84_OIKDI|nr:Oidioi.mRNA.OKI2018_I69.PAR.g8910.t1.cds [Oikopleura dioica]
MSIFRFFIIFHFSLALESHEICQENICRACALITGYHHFCMKVKESKCCDSYNAKAELNSTEPKKDQLFEDKMEFTNKDVIIILLGVILFVFLVVKLEKMIKKLLKNRSWKKMKFENIEIHI